jgi:hypothetical protein
MMILSILGNKLTVKMTGHLTLFENAGVAEEYRRYKDRGVIESGRLQSI